MRVVRGWGWKARDRPCVQRGDTDYPRDSQREVSQHPKSSSQQRSCTFAFLPGLFTTPSAALGTPSRFHRPRRRWGQRHHRDKATRPGNTSLQAAASQPPSSRPTTGSTGSPGRLVWHGGSPAGDSTLHPHLQTSRTALAGWTGQWLRSLGQGESTASQVSQNPQGCTPAPSSPCISLPR